MFRYAIGQPVEFAPPGEKSGRFKVVRRMPTEDARLDLKYVIKSEREEFERTVLECQLSAET
jgi:hypothetical protein